MEGIAAIVQKVIAEHKVIMADFKSLEKVGNDATALKAIEKGKELFMPGRLDASEGLKQFEAVRVKLDQGLLNHFDWEERTLLDAFIEYKAFSLVPALKRLMSEHDTIREGLGELKGLTEELRSEHLSHQMWEPKGYEMRAFIIRLFKTVETHAIGEQSLLNDLLRQSMENAK
jgi:iron-sulfur cluster repair protein YtfE (RIC family)